jgi:uncharacterized membrane protein SpoIIM required for sporulation
MNKLLKDILMTLLGVSIWVILGLIAYGIYSLLPSGIQHNILSMLQELFDHCKQTPWCCPADGQLVCI